VSIRVNSTTIDPSGTIAMKASTAANLPMGLERDILKSLRIPLAVIDNDFNYLWLNREMARIYRTQPEQISGKICYKVISEQAGPCHDCPVVAVQRSGCRETSQKFKDFPNGVRKYGEVSAFPIYGLEEKIVATLVMVIDITDKIVVDTDAAYQTLSRMMPALNGMTSQRLISAPQGVNEKDRRDPANNYHLTHRETQVLRLLAKGYSNTQIASRLGISPHTVKSHVINIFNKLGVNDRIQAAVVATKQNIID
jgi:PAS domain S-box-containing protein